MQVWMNNVMILLANINNTLSEDLLNAYFKNNSENLAHTHHPLTQMFSDILVD